MIKNRLESVQETKSLLKQIVKIDDEERVRQKRGVFNFIGVIAKTLFGTLDEADAEFYQEKISKLEQEQLGMLKVAKNQMTVVRSTLQTINSTLYQVTLNEQRLKGTLKEVQEHMNNETLQIQKLVLQNSLRIAINRHFIELEDCINQVKEQYGILLRAVTNAQNGVIQPEIISPSGLIRSFQRSQNIFPKDVYLPVALSMTNSDKLLKISEISIFISKDILSYVIQTPLVNNIVYNVYKLIPFPTSVNESKTEYIFIDTHKEYLLIDNAKQMYQLMDEYEIRECKSLSDELRICKQVLPLMFTHTTQECVVRLMQSNIIPNDCMKKIIHLEEFLWIPLEDQSQWIYVAPYPEKVTVMCSTTDPNDKIIQGVGIISFYEPCKCYSTNAKIRLKTPSVVRESEVRYTGGRTSPLVRIRDSANQQGSESAIVLSQDVSEQDDIVDLDCSETTPMKSNMILGSDFLIQNGGIIGYPAGLIKFYNIRSVELQLVNNNDVKYQGFETPVDEVEGKKSEALPAEIDIHDDWRPEEVESVEYKVASIIDD
ncbi:uncharacterized protein [Anabrus simplex]|uniref:uncharacterized protein n=1 Tax=Anabrus simplex TaxID=316456 RepID=UPI0035A2BA73